MKQYDVKLTTQFKKQLKGLQKQKKLDTDALNEIIELLSSNKLLPLKYRNQLLNPRKNRYLGMSCSTRCPFRV